MKVPIKATIISLPAILLDSYTVRKNKCICNEVITGRSDYSTKISKPLIAITLHTIHFELNRDRLSLIYKFYSCR